MDEDVVDAFVVVDAVVVVVDVVLAFAFEDELATTDVRLLLLLLSIYQKLKINKIIAIVFLSIIRMFCIYFTEE